MNYFANIPIKFNNRLVQLNIEDNGDDNNLMQDHENLTSDTEDDSGIADEIEAPPNLLTDLTILDPVETQTAAVNNFVTYW